MRTEQDFHKHFHSFVVTCNWCGTRHEIAYTCIKCRKEMEEVDRKKQIELGRTLLPSERLCPTNWSLEEDELGVVSDMTDEKFDKLMEMLGG